MHDLPSKPPKGFLLSAGDQPRKPVEGDWFLAANLDGAHRFPDPAFDHNWAQGKRYIIEVDPSADLPPAPYPLPMGGFEYTGKCREPQANEFWLRDDGRFISFQGPSPSDNYGRRRWILRKTSSEAVSTTTSVVETNQQKEREGTIMPLYRAQLVRQKTVNVDGAATKKQEILTEPVSLLATSQLSACVNLGARYAEVLAKIPADEILVSIEEPKMPQ